VRARTDSPLKMIRAEVVESEVESAVKAVEELKSEGKEVTRFVGDKAYDANTVYATGVDVVVPPRENASTRTPRQEEGGQGVQEVRLGTLEEREGLRSEVVDRVGLLGREEELRRGRQGYELRGSGARGRAQFEAYSRMCLANLVVGRAPGVEVKGWAVNSGKTGLP